MKRSFSHHSRDPVNDSTPDLISTFQSVCLPAVVLQVKRMEVAARLWAAGIKAEFGYKANPKMGDQLNYALEEAGV